MSADHRFAVLIDADNVSEKYIQFILDELATEGTITYKRIYGDWTKPALGSWKGVLLDHSITPIQQYSYTVGKNATDSAMIIDAMDILYTGNVEGFCIVSSDSDFTRLATRLREAGMKVIGIGEKKTPAPFIAACEKFIYLEILKPHTEEKDEKKTVKGKTVRTEQKAQSKIRKNTPLPKDVIRLIANSIDIVADDEGWAFLGEIGNLISKKRPDFDSRNYGFPKLSDLIRSTDMFETDFRDTNNKGVKHIYIRNRT